MKTIIIFVSILIISVNIFPQNKIIESGLYLVISKGSCKKTQNNIKIKYASDTLCLEQKPEITVGDIESCNTGAQIMDGNEIYALNISLKESAKIKLKEITEKNTGKRMALVIDKEVVMAAIIRDPITSGRLTVSGAKAEEINSWAAKLREAIDKK
jgi:preprotein translocase subunit SecD